MTRLEWAILSLILLFVGCWIADHFTGFLPSLVSTVLPVWGGLIASRKVIVPWLRDEGRGA